MTDICYKKNCLNEVIARIDFAKPVVVLNKPVLPDNIQKVLKERYPIFEPSKGKTQDVTINDDGVSAVSEEFHQWIYHGNNREKTITITQHFISVSLKDYKDYDEFKLDVIKPIEEISSLEGEIFISRTGLRYVNIFPSTVSSLKDFKNKFSPMISSSFNSIVDEANLSRNILISEYLYDEIKLRIQSGLFNPDYPAKLKNMEFALDLDAIVDTPHSFTNMNGLFDRLHETIEDKFEALITDELRDELNA